MNDMPISEEHKRRGALPSTLDPRKAVDPASLERIIRAQERARAQAVAATTVVVGTIVTLVSSAFGFVAALAWNDAIKAVLARIFPQLNGDAAKVEVIRALVFTLVAIIAIVILQRIAGRWAKNAAIGSSAGDGSY